MPRADLDHWMQAVRELGPTVAAHRSELDVERRLPAPIFEAMADAGLLRLWMPRALGGPEVPPEDLMAIIQEAASLDASVGWVLGIGAGMSIVAGYLPDAIARQWFKPRRAFIAHAVNPSGTAEHVGGGYLINGRWSFASGIHHASMVMANCVVSAKGCDRSSTDVLSLFFPQKQAVIEDDWHVTGLRGTGSCSFEARDVFVPREHVIRAFLPEATQPGDLYRLPNLSLLSLIVAAVPLGIAKGALADGCRFARSQTRRGEQQLLRDRETAQVEFGRARALLKSARSFLRETLVELAAAIDGDKNEVVEKRIQFKLACAQACESAVRVVDHVAMVIGSASLRESDPLERRVRDIHAAAKHIAVSPRSFELAGRRMLGLDVGTNRF